MAYIGTQPTVGNFVKLDAITTSATATFNLTNGGIVGLGVQTTVTSAYIYTIISPPMRVTPTLTSNSLICSDSVSFDSSATLSSVDGTGDSIYYNVDFATSGAQFRGVNLRATSNTSGSLDMSSEL